MCRYSLMTVCSWAAAPRKPAKRLTRVFRHTVCALATVCVGHVCVCVCVFWPNTNTWPLTFIKAPVSQFYNLTHSLTTFSRELNELFWKRWHKNKQNSGCRPAMINSSATDRCLVLLERRHMETIYNPTGWPSKSIVTHVSFRSDQSWSW